MRTRLMKSQCAHIYESMCITLLLRKYCFTPPGNGRKHNAYAFVVSTARARELIDLRNCATTTCDPQTAMYTAESLSATA